MQIPAPPLLFDRQRYAQRRSRAAADFSDFNFLHQRAMLDIVDRLETINRSFPKALFYGVGNLSPFLTEQCAVGDIIHGDLTQSRLPKDSINIVYDEEAAPFASGDFDLIVSLLTLHHVNDPVGALTQMRQQLKPDGLMLGVLFGEETLKSLRTALYQAETKLKGGVSPRISPFASVRDLGSCLQRAGFALPVADIDTVNVSYKNPMRLLSDLRGMGETSVLQQRGNPLSRNVLMEAVSEFEKNGSETRFDLVYLTGWAPHENQQKPLQPGAATSSLETAISHPKK